MVWYGVVFWTCICVVLFVLRFPRIVYWCFGLRAYTMTTLAALSGRSLYKQDLWVRPPRSFVDFFRRGIFDNISHCWARTVSSAPSRYINVTHKGHVLHNRINMGSYDYLGRSGSTVFAPDDERWWKYRLDTRMRLSNERMLQEELGMIFKRPAQSVVLGTTGYGVNAHIATFIPSAIASSGRILVLSDELNHSSTIHGMQQARSFHTQMTKRVFRHNDVAHLDQVYRKACDECDGDFEAVLVIVEGIYSMEGHMCPLDQLVNWKLVQRHAVYLMVDEAHSFGACGPHGFGVTDHFGIDPDFIDFYMVTFSKVTSAIGGAIICTTPQVAEFIRNSYYSTFEPPAMCFGVSAQVKWCLQELRLQTPDVLVRLNRLKACSRLLRKLLKEQTDCEVIGDTAIVLVAIRDVTKAATMNDRLLEMGYATVLVGYPALPLSEGARLRFCVSAHHSESDIRGLVAALQKLRRELRCIKVARSTDLPLRWVSDKQTCIEVIENTPRQSISKAYLKRMSALQGEAVPVDLNYVIERYGIGSHGPSNFYGSTLPVLYLQFALADHYNRKHCVLFPEGQTVLEGVIRVLQTMYSRISLQCDMDACAENLVELVRRAYTLALVTESDDDDETIRVYWSQHILPPVALTHHCIVGTLEGTDIALLGGFCCTNNDEIAASLRLFARPYVFSASTPPYIAEYTRQLLFTTDGQEK